MVEVHVWLHIATVTEHVVVTGTAIDVVTVVEMDVAAVTTVTAVGKAVAERVTVAVGAATVVVVLPMMPTQEQALEPAEELAQAEAYPGMFDGPDSLLTLFEHGDGRDVCLSHNGEPAKDGLLESQPSQQLTHSSQSHIPHGMLSTETRAGFFS